MSAADVGRVVDEIAERLVRRFPHARPEEVRLRVAEVVHEYDASRVRDFVSILVEREVADELRRPVRPRSIQPV